ncbi:MAG TPA: T9SS type A sorting domain-containing protein [Chitinophagaceae bacterium]|jgi:hypothetical protein|nr:T9SS type A sorting domain-containing protein [Chitinophagaceae bacterium]
MKKILCALFLLATLSSLSKLNAQCTVAAPVISNIRLSTVNNNCFATFDLEYDKTGNNGNKYTGIYIYSGSLPTGFFGAANDVPTTATINNTPNVLATIEIDNTKATTSATYDAKNSVGEPTSFKKNLQYSITTKTDGSERFKILNILVPISCSGTADIYAAIGSTNQQSFSSFQCLVTAIPFRVNDPILNGQMACSNPRSFTFSANTASATQITFSAYSDAARTQLLTAPEGFVYSGYGTTSPIAITTYSNITLNTEAKSNISFGAFPYVSANGTKNNVYLSVSLANNTFNTNSLTIENSCAALPVSFKAFNAARNKEVVNVTWETAAESNNKGFNVQRNTAGAWKNVGFVASKADGGYSASLLSYSFADINTEKGVAQYRIEQVDIDGKAKFSEIRSVRGVEENGAKMSIFPNPSATGKVTLLFENATTKRDVIITDVAGRIVKQLNGVSGSSLLVENLTEGVYHVQVADLNQTKMTVQKIIITKR